MSKLHDKRMKVFCGAGLYLVTSRECSRGRETQFVVQRALEAGVRLVQLREKTLAMRDFCRMAETVRKLTSDAGALLLINDHVDVALAVGADGVHLGQEDLPVDVARRLGPELIIGASSHSIAEARAAEKMGASYVNIGPLFPTKTKEWSGDFLGLDGLRKISKAISIPFTVMGGIKERHVRDLVLAGANTIAVVSAVTAADDPGEAAGRFLELIAEARKE